MLTKKGHFNSNKNGNFKESDIWNLLLIEVKNLFSFSMRWKTISKSMMSSSRIETQEDTWPPVINNKLNLCSTFHAQNTGQITLKKKRLKNIEKCAELRWCLQIACFIHPKVIQNKEKPKVLTSYHKLYWLLTLSVIFSIKSLIDQQIISGVSWTIVHLQSLLSRVPCVLSSLCAS